MKFILTIETFLILIEGLATIALIVWTFKRIERENDNYVELKYLRLPFEIWSVLTNIVLICWILFV
jgi:hypothetical protein